MENLEKGALVDLVVMMYRAIPDSVRSITAVTLSGNGKGIDFSFRGTRYYVDTLNQLVEQRDGSCLATTDASILLTELFKQELYSMIKNGFK